jgi:hypothetical protein
MFQPCRVGLLPEQLASDHDYQEIDPTVPLE